jgi:hypothetical protein
MRQDILELGPDAVAYLTELVHRRPDRWGSDVKILYRLLTEYGPDPLREAICVFRRCRSGFPAHADRSEAVGAGWPKATVS